MLKLLGNIYKYTDGETICLHASPRNKAGNAALKEFDTADSLHSFSPDSVHGVLMGFMGFSTENCRSEQQ